MNSSPSNNDDNNSSSSNPSGLRQNITGARSNPRYNFLSSSVISTFTGRNRSIQEYNDASPVVGNRNHIIGNSRSNRQN